MSSDRRRRGFALIVVMTLLALVVLMILSLVTMVQLSLRATKATLQQELSRQNALLAVGIAVGKIEEYAGPDMRTTATADLGEYPTGAFAFIFDVQAQNKLAYPTNRPPADTNRKGLATPAPSGGTRYWTGVWGNVDAPGSIFSPTYNTPGVSPVLLTWLVSGNEGSGYALSNLTLGNITQAPGQSSATVAANTTFKPNMAVTGLTRNSTAFSGDLKMGNRTAVLLVGANTTSSEPEIRTLVPATPPVLVDALKRYVVAPLVDITAPGTTPGGVTQTGRYAWWVGDEGVKAKYNVTDPNANLTNITTQTEARRRFMASPRTGIERLTGFDTMKVADTTFNSVLGRVISPSQILSVSNIAGGNLTEDNARFRFHDLTTYSKGVLANSQRGGLREDLTTQFEAGTPTLTGNILPDGNSTTFANWPNVTSVSPRALMAIDGGAPAAQGLKWDLLRSYYKGALPINSTNPVSISALTANATGTKAPIAPVIAQIRMTFGVYVAGTASAPIGYAATQFAVQLGNPYAFPIKNDAPLQLSFMIDTDTKYEWGLGLASRPSQNADAVNNFTRDNNAIKVRAGNFTSDGSNIDGYFPILKNTSSTEASVLDNVYFEVPANVTWQPGEIKTFWLGVKGEPVFPFPQSNLRARLINEKINGATTAINVKTIETTPSQPVRIPLVNAATDGLPETFFLVNMGAFNAFSSDYSMFGALLPSVACTVELRLGGAGAGKGKNILQRLVNIDLSGAAVSGSDPSHPVPGGGFRFVYDRDWVPQPFFLGGYYTWVASSDSPQVQVVLSEGVSNGGVATSARNDTNYNYNLTAVTNYRTFADFNLRAANLALPPTAPFNKPQAYQDFAQDPGNGFPTVPPFVRMFDQGTDPDVSNETEAKDALAVQGDTFGKNMAKPRWGYSVDLTSPTTNLILFDLPRVAASNDVPIISLGQLQHASVGADDDLLLPGYQPGHAIGNSWAPPFLLRGTSVSNTTGAPQLNKRSTVNKTAASGNVTMYDISYLLNTALWDRYFFSSILQRDSDVGKPVNSRLSYAAGYVPTATDLGITGGNVTDLATGKPMPKAMAPARYLMVDGAFNINSTSVEAWKAVLSGLRGVPVGSDQDSASAASKYTRVLRNVPSVASNFTIVQGGASSGTLAGVAQPVDGTSIAGGNVDGKNGKSYAGYRRLSDQQISALATKIVEQVKLRGPFLSLGQFVNRKLIGPVDNNGVPNVGGRMDPQGLSGALQSAIDNTGLYASISGGQITSNANANSVVNPFPGAQLFVGTTSVAYPDQAAVSSQGNKPIVATKTAGNKGQATNQSGNSITLVTPGKGNLSVSRSELGSRLTGIPGWLTQADLLEALGPIIAARSDTFLVRAYGETLSPLDGAVQSRSWCEAVVQRYPDYVDSTNAPSDNYYSTDTSTSDVLTNVNKLFGRKFRLVSLRWLEPADI